MGTNLSQILTGRFPAYSIAVQLYLPLRNRVAQADLARAAYDAAVQTRRLQEHPPD